MQDKGMVPHWGGIDPKVAHSYFVFGNLFLWAGLTVLLWIFWKREPRSGFRFDDGDKTPFQPFEAARLGEPAPAEKPDRARKAEPLRLTGARVDAPAHELLGISADATESEIQKAWRELMKRYHPDVVGRPGSREWTDAQKIAEAVNRAKDEMLKRARARAHAG